MNQSTKCVKCNGKLDGPFDRYIEAGIKVRDDHAKLMKNKTLVTEAYVCLECGYVEQYLAENDLKLLRQYREGEILEH